MFVGIASGAGDAVAERDLVVVESGEFVVVDRADERPAPGHARRTAGAFLVREGDHRQTVLEGDPGVFECCRHLDGGDHAVRAVEPSAVDDGVEVAPAREPLRPGAGAATDQVGSGVDRGIEAGLGHPRGDQIATRDVVGAERLARHAAVGGLADLAQLRQPFDQASAVDPELGVAHGSTSLPSRMAAIFFTSASAVASSTSAEWSEPARHRRVDVVRS